MKKTPADPGLTPEDLDILIDRLLETHIVPSNDFRERVMSRIQSEKVTKGPWSLAPSWIKLIGTMAAALIVIVGFNFMPKTQNENLQPTKEVSRDVQAPSAIEKRMQPESTRALPDTIFEAEELLRHLSPILTNDRTLLDLNMLLES